MMLFLAARDSLIDFFLKNPKLLIVAAAVLWGLIVPVIRGLIEAKKRALEIERKRQAGELPTSPLLQSRKEAEEALDEAMPTTESPEVDEEEEPEAAPPPPPRYERPEPIRRAPLAELRTSTLDGAEISRVPEEVDTDLAPMAVLDVDARIAAMRRGFELRDDEFAVLDHHAEHQSTPEEAPEAPEDEDAPRRYAPAMLGTVMRVPVREAVLWSEILGPPVSMRRPGAREGSYF